RRLGAGDDREPDQVVRDGARDDGAVRVARSRRRPHDVRPDHGAPPRRDLRDRADGRPLRPADPHVHARAAGGDPGDAVGAMARTVLVTGAAGGIGGAIADAFGACGDVVYLNDLSHERLAPGVERLRARGADARPAAADIADEPSVRAMVEAV